MPGKAIFRISKLKSFGAIAGAEHHNSRTRETLNADPEKRRDNFVFLGEADRPLEVLARERIGGQKIRKNAVLAVDVFISASPEYFRPDNPGEAGDWDADRLESWLDANEAFLQAEFGEERILRAECHLDESTPHIHAVVVPLTDSGKLSYRQLYGGKRTELSKLQDRAWSAVSDLGIERGVKGSRATHREVKDWYAEMQQPLDQDLDMETVRVQLADKARIERENLQLKEQAAALSRTLDLRNQEKQDLLQQNLLMQGELRVAHGQVESWKERYGKLVDPLRDLPLERVAEELCLQSDFGVVPRWCHEGHQIRINGSKFFDWHEAQMTGGGGAIDLVMHVNQSDFKSAVAWLDDRFGEATVRRAGSEYAIQQSKVGRSDPFIAPVQSVEQWDSVRDYFVSQKLPGGLIDALHDQGLLYADKDGNAVFMQRDFQSRELTGAYVMSGDAFSGSVIGSDLSRGRFYWLRGGQPDDAVKRVVVGQSPGDVLALGCARSETIRVMDNSPQEKTMYLSADGSLPMEYFSSLEPQQLEMRFNRDVMGRNLAQQTRAELPQVEVQQSNHEDWLQALKIEQRNRLSQELQRQTRRPQRER